MDVTFDGVHAVEVTNVVDFLPSLIAREANLTWEEAVATPLVE